MKKLFLLALAFVSMNVFAQTNLFDKTTATFESWFGDAGWGTITTSTAAYDATAGAVTVNINQDPYGQWHAQLKLTATDIVLDPAKNYEFKAKFNSTHAFGGVTIKVFDQVELSMVSDYALVVGDNNYTSAAFAGRADLGNKVIVFDLGNATNGSTVVISDIIIQESTQAVVEDPKPTTAPAAPTADAATVASVYCNTYPAAAPFGYNESWGQTTTLEELNLDGNTVLYYKRFNWLGWATSQPIDASDYTGLHLDIWAPAAGQIRVVPIYGGTGLTTDDSHGKMVTLAEGWNAVDLDLATDFAGLNLNSIFQFKFDQGTITEFALDNVYFFGRTSSVVYTGLADVYNKANNDTVYLKDFEVVYVPATDSRYYYIKDATASGLIYKSNYGLVAGDKVAKGMAAKVSIYNNLYELVPITAKADLEITAGTPAEPALATAAPTAADNKYVVYKNVTFLADSIGTTSTAVRTVKGLFGADTVTFYNTFKVPAVVFEAGKKYDVTGLNTCYNTNIQVAVASIEEHPEVADPCAGEHGLYDASAAVINSTYFAAGGWAANPGCTADISNGTITIHVDQPFVDPWNGQVFVNPGFTFEVGKMYHYEFDVTSAGKVGLIVKVNDAEGGWFYKELYDINIGGGTTHFSTDSVIVGDNLVTTKGPLIFGFAWTDGNQDVVISCIKISEMGEAPEPVEDHMYIKHPWGTGANDDWSWQEMTAFKYRNAFDAWKYTGAWGGVGFNIADNAEGNDAKWFAADKIAFRNQNDEVVEAPAVGTENCEFVYIPAYDVEGALNSCVIVSYTTSTALENTEVKDASKFFENGQIVILKNGVRYNVLGQKL